MIEPVDIPETPETEISAEQLADLGEAPKEAQAPESATPHEPAKAEPAGVNFLEDLDLRGKGQAGKKRGPYRKRGDKVDGGEKTPPLPIDVVRAPEKSFDKEAARKTGEQLGKMVIGIVGQFPPNSLPQTPTEQALAQGAVAQTGEYFVSKELPELPPSLALIAAWSTYYMVVISADRNREAAKSFWTKVKSNFAQWRAARKAKKEAEKGE